MDESINLNGETYNVTDEPMAAIRDRRLAFTDYEVFGTPKHPRFSTYEV